MIFLMIFFLAFIIFTLLGFKHQNICYPILSINSGVTGCNSLKDILPSHYTVLITSGRIIVGLLLITIFIYYHYQNKK